MKSRTSFFNRGLSLSLLRRSWPIWTSYFAILLLMVPADLMTISQDRSYRGVDGAEFLFRQINRAMLGAGVNTAILSFFACILVAMVVFSYMYNNRSCSMYNSLPLKRETVFSTAFITGLVPMLLIDVLIALICFAFFTGENMVEPKNIWLFLSMALMSNVAFFGFAAFCSVLTGSLFVLPAVYVVLNLATSLAQIGVQAALDTVVYGYSSYGEFTLFTLLSPIVMLTNRLNVQAEYERIGESLRETGVYTVYGMNYLAIYCAAGLVLAVFALLLYRRRKMETVGDVVSIPVLKPIFKYCMSFGVALMFAYAVYHAIFGKFLTGRAEAGVYLLVMIVGAFIGYFVSEMLMQKTLRVFGGKWKGFFVSCAVLALFIGIAEFDLTGYEKRLPDLSKVDSVELSYYNGGSYEEEANIKLLRDFHQLLIDEKEINEEAESSNVIMISYVQGDKTLLSRRYNISFDPEQKQDENSSVNALGRVINLQEAIDNRAATPVPVSQYNLIDTYLSGYKLLENGDREHYSLQLTAAQAAEFYNECVLPDAAEGRLCRVFPVENEEYFSMVTPVSFHFSIINGKMDSMNDWYNSYHDFTMYLDAERCCKWIEENTDIELFSIGEADPEYRDEMLLQLAASYPRPTAEYYIG